MSNQKNIDAIIIVANAVKKYRIAKCLTQRQLANLLNTDVSHVSRIELGKVNTTVSTLFQLAKVLGVKPEDLITID